MESTRTLKLIIAALLLLSISFAYITFFRPQEVEENNKDAICTAYGNEPNNISTLSTTVISDLVERYRANQLLYINDNMRSKGLIDETESDAHTIWFDLDTIKKFIYHIEHNVALNNHNSVNKLGLRMYYAAYPAQSEFSKVGFEDLSDLNNSTLTKKYGLKHTLVMVPTIFNSSIGEDVDFNPLDATTYDGYISQEKKTKVENSPELIAPYQAAGYQPMALTPNSRVAGRNHGGLYPPGNIIGLGF